MHARKLPRISEPSFDKDYYENGRGYTSKYSSSGKMRSYGGGGGSSSSYRRSVSPDIRNQSPRDRNGPKHHSIRRLDRDHQHNNKYGSSRKDRDRGVGSGLRDRSPKDRGNVGSNSNNTNKWDSQTRDRELAGGGGGGTNSGGGGRTEPKIKTVADWSEHISSSGKKYYYNSVTEVSQWEKPRDWLDYERLRGVASSSSSKTPSCDPRTNCSRVVSSSSNGSSNPALNSSLIRTSRPQRADDNQSLSTPSSNDRLSTPSSTVSSNNSYENPHNYTPSHHGHSLNQAHQHYNRNHSENYESVAVTDMDTSPQSDNSPTSINGDEQNTLGMHHSVNHHLQHQYQPSPSSGGLPILQSHPQMATPNSNSNLSQNSQISDVSPYSGASPPTPTHSEQENQCDSILQNCNQSQTISGPMPLQNVGSLTQVVSSPLTALKPQPPLLTPSLARLYREPLISHVTGWPSEMIEKACQKVNEEHQTLTNLALTKLNSEIKSLRSSLRVQDVFTTLHEQRALSLRLMNQELEAMSPTGGLMPMEDMSNNSTQLS